MTSPSLGAELEAGASFGRYRIEACIGEGGMGRVYRALDTSLHRRVALKLLLVPRADSAWAEASARMLREARASAAFEHPHAVRVHDVGEIDGAPYIAMEYVPGKPLSDFVGDASVPLEARLRWLVDAASALGAAHEAGLVHRDVKPGNVIVREDGQVKVLDFGIARRVGGAVPARDETTLTTEGIVVGTLQYMPPEQLAAAPVDGRTDQFAWAVMAYELLAGEPPWPKQADVVAMVTAILQTPPAPLGSVVPSLQPSIAAAIHKALARLPGDRFASMADLVAILEPHAALVPGRGSSSRVARPSSSSRRAGVVPGKAPAAPRSRRRVGALAAAMLVLAAGGGAARSLLRGHDAAPSSIPASTATTLLDLPPPASVSVTASRAFREGLQAEHDANQAAAREGYLAALRDDPSLGAAHLRYAVLTSGWDPASSHAHFLKAQELRTGLGDHERVLVDALGPVFDETPPGWAEADRRLTVAVQARPRDAGLWSVLGWLRKNALRVPEAIEALDTSTRLDPSYAAAFEERVRTAVLAGDLSDSVAAADRCLAASPSAVSCLEDRILMVGQVGRCEDVERDARRILAIDASNATAYQDLGQLALARGQPVEGALELLRLGWARSSADWAAWVEADDRSRAAVVRGDLTALDAGVTALRELTRAHTDLWSHFEVAELLVSELSELGAFDRAAQAAADYLAQAPALTPNSGLVGFAWDDVPLMLHALERAGRIARPELEARRASWIASWRPRMPSEATGRLWLYAYAGIADTPADAVEALARLADFGAVATFRPWRLGGARMGRVLLLAGRPDDAIPLLEEAVASCTPLEEPVTWVQASLWLGEAREQKGLTSLACGDYASVVRRFGPFGLRSSSLVEARRHMRALGCPLP